MSDFHDYEGVTRMDFDCVTDSRKEVVVQLPTDKDDLRQNVCVVVFTNEGVIFDFYEDGELVRTNGRTYEEWFDDAR
jgi:hypothetical protein